MAVVGVIRADLIANTAKFSRGIGRGVKDLNGLSAQSQATSATIGRLKTAVLGFVTATAILAGFRSMANAANDFQKAMAGSQAIMGRISGKMSGEMQAAALKVARDTVFSGKEAAGAYYFLASAGMDAQQSVAALPQVARFAQAGMFDLARATDLLTDAQSALGLSTKDPTRNLANLTRVSDVLVKANTLANASVEQFSEALTNKAAASARSVGKDVEETVAVLAAFADQGTKGADAGTAFSIVMRDLQTKALQNAEAFRNAGVAVYDSAGEMRNIADVIGDLEGRLGGMSDAQQKAELMMLGFSDKSVVYIQTLLGMSDKIREYEQALRSAAGTTDEVAEKQWTKFTKAMNTLKAAAEKLAVVLGEPLLNAIGDLVNGFTTMDPTIRQIVVGVTGFTAGFVLASKVLPVVIRFIKFTITALQGLVKAQIYAQALSGPKGWATIVAGLAVAAGAVYLVEEAFADLNKEQEKVAAKEIRIAQATDKVAASMKNLGEEASSGISAAAEEIKNLEQQIATFGMSPEQQKMAELRMGGATAEQLEKIRKLQDRLAMMEKAAEARQQAQAGIAGVTGPRNQEALVRGTQAAYAAENKMKNDLQRMVEGQNAQLLEMRRQTTLLEELAEVPEDQQEDIYQL